MKQKQAEMKKKWEDIENDQIEKQEIGSFVVEMKV